MYVKETAHLLTNDTICDPLQLFAERGHGMDRCSFGEHWENTTVVSKTQNLYNGPQLITRETTRFMSNKLNEPLCHKFLGRNL